MSTEREAQKAHAKFMAVFGAEFEGRAQNGSDGYYEAGVRRGWDAALAQPAQEPAGAALQGGMTNAQLTDAWCKKLPGVAPTDRELSAFALGIEVGFDHARDLERQDWNRVHHVLAKHGAHPGRTDEHLADVIDRALTAPQPQPAQGGAAKLGPIKIGAVHRGAYFDWSQDGCGFGQLSFDHDEMLDALICSSECMGREWVRFALYALADHIADSAYFTEPHSSEEAAPKRGA